VELGKGVIFILIREDIIGCAQEIGIPEELIDDEFLEETKYDSGCLP